MRIVSSEDCEAWCRQRGIPLNSWRLPERAAFPAKFPIPQDAGQRVSLVARSMAAFADENELLVWFHDWGVWPSGERMHIFDRFRKSYGESRRLIDSPGHIFSGNEIEDAISFVTLSVLFLWDCYILTPKGRKLLFFSHDEYGLTNGDLAAA